MNGGRNSEEIGIRLVVEGLVEVVRVAHESALRNCGGRARDVRCVVVSLAAVENGGVEGVFDVCESRWERFDARQKVEDLILEAGGVLNVGRSEQDPLQTVSPFPLEAVISNNIPRSRCVRPSL